MLGKSISARNHASVRTDILDIDFTCTCTKIEAPQIDSVIMKYGTAAS